MKTSTSPFRRALFLGLTLTAALLPRAAQAQFSSPVRITNTTTQSVPVKDQDLGARQPVYLHAAVTFFDGSYFPHLLPAANLYTVPANKRLVLEYFTADIPAMAGQRVRVTLQTTSAGNSTALYYMPLETPVATDSLNLQATSIASRLIRIYCDPGAGVQISVARSANLGVPASGDITFSGYLVDLLP
ncbi:hypothetical protein [Paludibaculum fermentans]|uniref:Uncharacterized protein n=1 Tax=Paludibaculum fermentans TaxID=1473598 RepID=A0A7S7NU82_PALFE|nr:hypothetical protein [Paludibaculum fermentans]QOY89877.1 hypothetical protein IRI77_07960 [Paludibaculum fermentans]